MEGPGGLQETFPRILVAVSPSGHELWPNLSEAKRGSRAPQEQPREAKSDPKSSQERPGAIHKIYQSYIGATFELYESYQGAMLELHRSYNRDTVELCRSHT